MKKIFKKLWNVVEIFRGKKRCISEETIINKEQNEIEEIHIEDQRGRFEIIRNIRSTEFEYDVLKKILRIIIKRKRRNGGRSR